MLIIAFVFRQWQTFVVCLESYTNLIIFLNGEVISSLARLNGNYDGRQRGKRMFECTLERVLLAHKNWYINIVYESKANYPEKQLFCTVCLIIYHTSVRFLKNCFFFLLLCCHILSLTDKLVSYKQLFRDIGTKKTNFIAWYTNTASCVFFPWKLLLVNIVSAYMHFPHVIYLFIYFDIILTPFTINWTVIICKAIIWTLMWLAVALQWLIWCPVHNESKKIIYHLSEC